MKKITVGILFSLVLGLSTYAQVDEYRAKATFVYNFSKFFEWPITERAGNFIIGVVGSNSMASNLEKVTAGKSITGQQIQVVSFRNSDEVSKCHVIFVSSASVSSMESIKSKTGHYTLIVTDSEGAIQKGSAINFFLESEKLKYEFSGSNAESMGLKYHSQLEQMAAKTY